MDGCVLYLTEYDIMVERDPFYLLLSLVRLSSSPVKSALYSVSPPYVLSGTRPYAPAFLLDLSEHGGI